MDRIQFIKAQAAALERERKIVANDAAALQQFEQLVLDTYDALAATGRQLAVCPSWTNFADSSFYAPMHAYVPASILARWRQWPAIRRGLLQRNPRLELYLMMQEIGETDQFKSWPYFREGEIQEWLDHGEMNPPPFSDVKGIVTPAFYNRLRELRRKIGGWLYWDSEDLAVVFLPEDQWQQLRRDPARTTRLDGRGAP